MENKPRFPSPMVLTKLRRIHRMIFSYVTSCLRRRCAFSLITEPLYMRLQCYRVLSCKALAQRFYKNHFILIAISRFLLIISHRMQSIAFFVFSATLLHVRCWTSLWKWQRNGNFATWLLHVWTKYFRYCDLHCEISINHQLDCNIRRSNAVALE